MAISCRQPRPKRVDHQECFFENARFYVRRCRYAYRGLIAAAVGGVLTLTTLTAAQAAPAPLTDPTKAAEIAGHLGNERTAGVYYRNERLVVAVTDEAAAEAVRSAGAVAEVVPHSTTELEAVKAKLDQLTGIPNTAWSIDQSSNRVDVQIYDGVSDADRARIENSVSAHEGAVEITEHSGKIESNAYAMRGGLGITAEINPGWITTCSAGFNVQNASGKKYMITAGHCMENGAVNWRRRSGDIPLGRAVDWAFGNDTEQSDYGVVEYSNSNVTPYGTIQYKDGSEGQISRSASAFEGEKVKRVGTVSQDLVGKVLATDVTVTYDDGITLRHMVEASNCSMYGDSGGPLFSGETALGIDSGGNYGDKPCGDSDSQEDRVSWYQPLYTVLLWEGLKIY
ncbi:S1 family peptidase [Streptomyces botrytidirepellens]|uniref:S1 family peptidase n=1 Tax=Streptomyces botrytidirepellens TaxID=2486417 RepID=A0A3M8X0V6_9ACTN|nr:S1 family peptidase [Streptomyces botrytidirepellens]RNG36068.1 S1 family peptidase [Streptomyces botrytidirepellens]